MVLSGTLREYILADVLQLLTQQKITGKLILNNGRNEGFIVFRNGTIVAAARDQETFPAKLFYYLTEILQQPKNKVRELFSSYESKTADLTLFLENKGIISHEELESYATAVTIDITCSLFLWKTGNYRFDSLRTVDHLIPAGIDIPVENVVMEAMRRIDEWHRMRQVIDEETILAHTGKQPDIEAEAGPLDNPSLYFYHRIDGTSAVKTLLNDAFLTEFKIYESLYALIQEDLIKPLSETVTRSIRAAIQKKEQDTYAASALPPLVSILVTIGLILLLIFLAWIFRGVLFSKLNINSSIRNTEIHLLAAEEHYRDAQRYFRAQSLIPSSHNSESSWHSSLTRKDLHYLSLKRNFDNRGAEQYNTSKRKKG